jgi:hypothetical protein
MPAIREKSHPGLFPLEGDFENAKVFPIACRRILPAKA